MKIDVPVEELSKAKLFLATPMYGAQCTGMYARAVADLTAACMNYGIQMQFYFLFNESLITRARNYCVDEFLRSDCTHMMFIDSDIHFNAKDVIAMIALNMTDPEKYQLICGPYPKKTIAWEKIKQAVDSGIADDNANILEKYVGDYVFNPLTSDKSMKIADPCPVKEGGTGFMMITRGVFDKYKEMFPELHYKPDHIRTANFDGSREIMAYFDCIIDPESKRYLSEDYMFCYNAQKAGVTVWMCPWMALKHVGTYVFGGSLADLATIGAAATADPGKLGKKK